MTRVIDLQSLLQVIWNGLLRVIGICREQIIISYFGFQLSFFDCMISLVVIGFLFSVIFPHFVGGDDDE